MSHDQVFTLHAPSAIHSRGAAVALKGLLRQGRGKLGEKREPLLDGIRRHCDRIAIRRALD